MRTRFEQVADGVHAVLGSNGMPNAAWIDGGDDGAVVIDSRFTPAYARELVDGLREVTIAPVIALLNTHFHCDHVFGNPAIPTGRIIAHERALTRLQSLGDGYVETIRRNREDLRPELEGVSLRLPNETVSDSGLTLELPGITLQIRYAGRRAHTDHDLYVAIPERGVLLAADLVFNGVVPVMRDGDLLGLRATLQELQTHGYEHVVPGHGEVGGPELLDRQLGFVELVLDACERAVAAGDGAESAAELALAGLEGQLFAKERIMDSVQQGIRAVQA